MSVRDVRIGRVFVGKSKIDSLNKDSTHPSPKGQHAARFAAAVSRGVRKTLLLGGIANCYILSISPVDRRSTSRAVSRVEAGTEPSGLFRKIDPKGSAIEKLSSEGRTGYDRGLLVECIHECERAFHYDADHRGILSKELFQLLLGRALDRRSSGEY